MLHNASEDSMVQAVRGLLEDGVPLHSVEQVEKIHPTATLQLGTTCRCASHGAVCTMH